MEPLEQAKEDAMRAIWGIQRAQAYASTEITEQLGKLISLIDLILCELQLRR
jgi:hypothetical protein